MIPEERKMKFTCEKNAILHEISIAHEIISSRNTITILSNVLLEADNNTLIIRATDLKVGFETKIPVDVAVPGVTTVFCDKFLGILRSLPDGEVEFELLENKLFIRPLFKKIDFQLKSISSEKFPELQETQSENYFEFPQAELIEMISQTIFSISDDETRYFMNGVYLEHQEGKLVMVATDGRRLSFISKSIDTPIKEFQGIIIPPKILNLVKKLSSGEGNLSLAITDKNLFIQFDNQKISSNLIEGQFPNYNRVIPEKQDYQIIVNRGEFIEALKRVSLLVEQSSRRIYLMVEGDTMVLQSEESEIGIAKEEISCQFEGPDTSIALNYLYLTDPLKGMSDNEVSIQFTESNKAISIVPVPEKDYFHIVMPMQMD